ncbi:MAG TPA: cation:proton antiporter, partial [Clostridia bacterium]|nr:cation:proton antiporter [Clostridia bacterium]
MSTLLYVGILLLSGLFFGKLAHRIGFPNVTGYLIAGLIIGPHALGIVPIEAVDGIGIVSELALGFIALSIGSELEWSYFKKLGMTSVVIAVFESLFAMGFVIIALLIFGFELPLAFMLGAIASATAPAATIMVIRQYRAKGPLTRTLLSVVAIDDAIAIIAFGFAATFAKTISSGIPFSIMTLFSPFIELALSIIIGVVFALVLLIPLHYFKKESNRMCGILGVISITSAVATYTGASALLACMVLGIV